MKKAILVLSALFFLGATGLATAQVGHPMSPKHRLIRQHVRIKQGVKDGTISPAEQQKLAQEGQQINQERKADLAKDGGKLTPADRASLEAQENARSKEIYQDKHPNGGTVASSTGSTSGSTTGSTTGTSPSTN
jgi:hypothetical protein